MGTKHNIEEVLVRTGNVIHFQEILTGLEDRSLNDVNNLVWLGCTASMTEAEDITNWFREIGLIEQDAEVVNIQHILGNVLGEKGRYDIMLTITGKGIINPIVRLQADGLRWLSDFVSNYRRDYLAD